MKFLLAILLFAFCFLLPIGAKGKHTEQIKKKVPTRLTKPTTVKSKSEKPVGLYEVDVYVRSWGNGPANVTEERGVKSDFKWLRLLANGTFRTNPINGKRIEGKYFFNSKTQTITWHIKSKHQTYLETNSTADFLSNKQKGKVITWSNGYEGGELGGRIYCHWVCP